MTTRAKDDGEGTVEGSGDVKPSAADPKRGLLLGLLAFQNGFIDGETLLATIGDWANRQTDTLGQILVDRGAIAVPVRALFESLVEKHVQAHGGDATQSLASLSVGRSTQELLARVHDPAIQATLSQVGKEASQTANFGSDDRGPHYEVSSETTGGQRFRILRPHARGGLGAVFVALDAELNREVALKQILDHHADDPVSRQRFLVEAEITGGLEHPGIVPVYGLGTYDGGRPYYAMRFVKGDNLKEAIESYHAVAATELDPGRRSLHLRQLLRRFTDVCNAIEYAHSRGVLHRDIKPGNVIVGRHGETLVVDWGLAKPTGCVEAVSDGGEGTLMPSSASGSAVTLPGSAMGTPAYMSPEQAAGKLEQVGPRSDVYSLGATLYCLLTGRPPFEGEVLEILRRVQAGDFRPPHSADSSVDRCSKPYA